MISTSYVLVKIKDQNLFINESAIHILVYVQTTKYIVLHSLVYLLGKENADKFI